MYLQMMNRMSKGNSTRPMPNGFKHCDSTTKLFGFVYFDLEMAFPQALLEKLKQAYPKPSIDERWLKDCYDWVKEEFHLGDHQVDNIYRHVNTQYLSSDLSDSTIPHSGIPTAITDETKKAVIGTLATGGPVLVQINAMTEIGHSAFNLRNVRQTRIDKVDMAGLAEEIDEKEDGPSIHEGEDFGVPDYPHSMLRMALSDGSRTLQAMEYRKISALQLGTTPLGCKLLLKNVTVRRGIALLEPKNTTVFAGSRVEELDVQQDILFNRGLRLRMGLQEIDPEEEELARRALVRESSPPNIPRHEGSRPQSAHVPISRRPSIHTPASTSIGQTKSQRLKAIQQALNVEVQRTPYLGILPNRQLPKSTEGNISFDDEFNFDEAALMQIDEVVAQARMLLTGPALFNMMMLKMIVVTSDPTSRTRGEKARQDVSVIDISSDEDEGILNVSD
ncbi:uncharacterized protein EI90DRAFT_2083060 [Cantharellus anzutake]|uniref:uncharacterized protein n=1 Tax=Cantharellus anzutake TaxID=1750568 RepID=UPI0019032BBD|nr:uncharacterized protein EI90DRAFT_2083060 [Cantharellus anzutake]KAF8340570.1 hypothetical protein EI90DRAFT_2083060 [Cantharellus anzutake]